MERCQINKGACAWKRRREVADRASFHILNPERVHNYSLGGEENFLPFLCGNPSKLEGQFPDKREERALGFNSGEGRKFGCPVGLEISVLEGPPIRLIVDREKGVMSV